MWYMNYIYLSQFKKTTKTKKPKSTFPLLADMHMTQGGPMEFELLVEQADKRYDLCKLKLTGYVTSSVTKVTSQVITS